MTNPDLIPQADVVIAAKRQALQERKSRTPIEAVRALASMQKRPQPILATVSQDVPTLMIGQVKYSPARSHAPRENYDPVTTALRFVKYGCDAVTLFTDEALYEGGLDDLVLISRAIGVPVISQNYILDEYQIVEARAAGASALVLSSAILEPPALRALVSSTQRNRMTAIVEVYTPDQIEYALSLSPYVIGITNRNPWTGELVDGQIDQLRQLIPPGIRVMVTDTMGTADEVLHAIQLGIDAILIQDSLLDQEKQMAEINTLLNRSRFDDPPSHE